MSHLFYSYLLHVNRFYIVYSCHQEMKLNTSNICNVLLQENFAVPCDGLATCLVCNPASYPMMDGWMDGFVIFIYMCVEVFN